jgi:hypothetical protein
MEDSTKNRLIIIGNGFDLAHGLKTCYNDFIDWVFKVKSQDGNLLRDKLFEVDYLSLSIQGYNPPIDSKYFFDNLVKFKPAITRKNIFFLHLVSIQNLRKWVDIENAYFQLMLDLLKGKDRYTKYSINKLNADFEEIKIALETYLSKEISFKKELNYTYYFDKAFKHDNIDKVLILNFNYTNFIKQYLYTFYNYEHDGRLNLINIHGELNNHKNPVIFGYGDEKHPEYNKILNPPSMNEEYLKNVKHYKYLQTKNYDRLVEFLDFGKFDIEIFGHSCGNSDRTLLNEIFEHENLLPKGVHVYKRGDENEAGQRRCFNDVIIQLSRVLNKSSPVFDTFSHYIL